MVLNKIEIISKKNKVKVFVDGVSITVHYDHPPDRKTVEKACIRFMQQIEEKQAKEKTPSTVQSSRCLDQRLIK